MPRVSVIIPTFNRALLVTETIDSVLAQTYRDFEIIVVDDSSTDNTSEVLSKYGDHIRVVVHPTNLGLSVARNSGIHHSAGEFVAFLDSDDLWLPTKLEQQINLLDATPGLDWVYADVENFDDKTGLNLGFYSQGQPPHQGNVLQKLIFSNFICTDTTLIRRTVFYAVGLFYDNEKTAEDWDMWLRIAAKYPVEYVAKPLARRRVHSEMKTVNRNWNIQYKRCVNTIEQAVAREPKRLGHLRRQAIARYCYVTGQSLISKRDLVGARTMFYRSIRLNPFVPKTYLYWLISMTGRPVINIASQFLRWLQHK